MQDEWPLLIVVPASLRLVWAEELERWLPHLRPSRIHVIEGKEHRVAQVCGRHSAMRSRLVVALQGCERVGSSRQGQQAWPVKLHCDCLSPPVLQGSVPLVCITSYEMMQRLTCDACKARAGPHASMCAGQRPPCADPMNCMASLRWRVVVVDGERRCWWGPTIRCVCARLCVCRAGRLRCREALAVSLSSGTCPCCLSLAHPALLCRAWPLQRATRCAPPASPPTRCTPRR